MNPENNPKPTGLSKNATAFGLSLALTSVINALLVIAKEKSPAVMTGMKRMTGHHWVTHSLITVVLFLILGCIFSRGQGPDLTARTLIRTVAAGVIFGCLIIGGFYLFGD